MYEIIAGKQPTVGPDSSRPAPMMNLNKISTTHSSMEYVTYFVQVHYGRRGAVINAIGAIDIALHDLRGKALGKPCYEFLGGAIKASVTPYASLQPEVSSFQAYRDSLVAWALDAKRRGFGAAKKERGLTVVPHI